MHPIAKGGVRLSVHGVRRCSYGSIGVMGFDSPHGTINFKKSYNYGNIIRTMRPAYGVGGA